MNETNEKDSSGKEFPKGYRPLVAPPDGYAQSTWEHHLRLEALRLEKLRRIDQSDPDYWSEMQKEHKAKRREDEIKRM